MQDLWTVLRMDDNGNKFVMKTKLDRVEADRMVEEYTRRGHKQTYWSEPYQQEHDKPEYNYERN